MRELEIKTYISPDTDWDSERVSYQEFYLDGKHLGSIGYNVEPEDATFERDLSAGYDLITALAEALGLPVTETTINEEE